MQRLADPIGLLRSGFAPDALGDHACTLVCAAVPLTFGDVAGATAGIRRRVRRAPAQVCLCSIGQGFFRRARRCRHRFDRARSLRPGLPASSPAHRAPVERVDRIRVIPAALHRYKPLRQYCGPMTISLRTMSSIGSIGLILFFAGGPMQHRQQKQQKKGLKEAKKTRNVDPDRCCAAAEPRYPTHNSRRENQVSQSHMTSQSSSIC